MFLFLFLLINSMNGLAQSNPPFNYYVFALECKDYICNDEWDIHGLWPEYTPTTWPQFCQPSRYGEFNATLLNEQFPDMCVHWPESQWQHEWMKHGTCTDLTMLGYFQKAYNIYKNATRQQYYSCCSKNKCRWNLNLNFQFIECN